MSSHPEFEVSRRHLFVNSNNRSRAPFSLADDGVIRLNVDALGQTAECEDGQFIRVSLLQFSSSNIFDRHLAPGNSYFLHIGSQIATAASFTSKTLVPNGVLANCTLLAARYDDFASIYLDIANSTCATLNSIYPTGTGSDQYSYSITRLGGGGPTFGIEGASQVTALGTNGAPLNFTPPFPVTLQEMGQYRQSGVKILTCSIRIQKNAGSFPVIFDNSTDDLSFGFVFSNANTTSLTCGATSTSIDPSNFSYLDAAAKMSSGLGVSPDSLSALALGSFNGAYTFSTTTSANDTLTITFQSRAPCQLDASPLLYLRLGHTGGNFETANMSSDTVQDPSVVAPSSILAAVPCQQNNLYYIAQGDPCFTTDFNVRSLHQLQLELTNEYGDTDWRSNAYRLSYFVTNVAFKCMLRISVIQKAVVATPEANFEDGTTPARFTAQPQTHIDNGRDRFTENITTMLARRGV